VTLSYRLPVTFHYFMKSSVGYSVVTIVFSDSREKYLGYAEASVGIG